MIGPGSTKLRMGSNFALLYRNGACRL